jgi:FkbM family methyltransferase
MTAAVGAKVASWSSEVRQLRRESRTTAAFLRLLQVRLSLSKVGPLVKRHPGVVGVDLESFGGTVYLRSHSSDISVLEELTLGATYEPVAAKARPDSRWIVDLGGNCGLSARWFLHRFPQSKVVVVEPEASNLVALRRNLADYADRVVVVAACAGGWERKVTLTSDNHEFAFAMSDLVDEESGDADVLTMPVILEHLAGADIDILKCDIEGAEEEVFDDCTAWIGRVGVAAIECHGDYTATGLAEDLRRNGMEPTVVEVQRAEEFGCEVVTLLMQPAAKVTG